MIEAPARVAGAPAGPAAWPGKALPACGALLSGDVDAAAFEGLAPVVLFTDSTPADDAAAAEAAPVAAASLMPLARLPSAPGSARDAPPGANEGSDPRPPPPAWPDTGADVPAEGCPPVAAGRCPGVEGIDPGAGNLVPEGGGDLTLLSSHASRFQAATAAGDGPDDDGPDNDGPEDGEPDDDEVGVD